MIGEKSARETLGHYRVMEKIGAGGMGVVYKGRDTHLDRLVALKVLLPGTVADPESRRRFAQEAKAASALNHPNIITVYDISNTDGVDFIAMEYVEGRTLEQLIGHRRMPLKQVLDYATQIADALGKAHAAGIIHRDLKPSNIMITSEDNVKILDFGLAKLVATDGIVDGEPTASTLETLTKEGKLLGTAAYMAPEQAEGKAVDARSDIFSFGLTLYKMLTGRRPFGGDTNLAMITAMLHEEPTPPSQLVPELPTVVERVVMRCLHKDPQRRWQSMPDLKLVLEDLKEESSSGRLPLTARLNKVWPGAAALLAVVAAGLGFVAYRATRPAELKPLVRLDVDLGTGVSLGSAVGTELIISPDGTRLVYVSQRKLFTRRMDQPKAVELAGTEGAFAPFFSPDGQWVAFFAQGKLKKISVEGGSAIALCDGDGIGGSWGEDGNIIAALGGANPLSRIPSAGGPPTPVTEFGPGEVTHRWPQILPGGKAVLFTAHNRLVYGFDEANIEVMSLADHRRKTLVRGGTFGRYSPSGHLMYINKGTLFAVPFDVDTLAVHGTPSPVLEQVAYGTETGYAQFDFSRSGTLIYQSGGAMGGGRFTAQWLDAAGKTQPLLTKVDNYLYPRLSPDGTRLALSAEDIWVYDWQRDIMTRLSFSGGVTAPAWSPDGKYIVYRAAQGMFWTRSDGAAKPQPLTQSKITQVPYSFTPDGKRLAFHELTGSGVHLWTVPIEGDVTGLRAGKPEPFLQTQFNERQPRFSSDGRWLTYASDESGTYQIYVRAFPDKGGKWQISNGGGTYPVFSPDGKDLFFLSEDNRIMVAEYTTKGDSFVAGKPRVWSEKKIAATGFAGSNYDVAPDGKRIAALMPVETTEAQQAQNHVVFLMNFFDELQRKVPAGK